MGVKTWYALSRCLCGGRVRPYRGGNIYHNHSSSKGFQHATIHFKWGKDLVCLSISISEIGVDVSLVVGYDHTEVYKHNYKFCNSQVGQMTELLTQTEQNQSFSPTSSWIPAHLLIKDNR